MGGKIDIDVIANVILCAHLRSDDRYDLARDMANAIGLQCDNFDRRTFLAKTGDTYDYETEEVWVGDRWKSIHEIASENMWEKFIKFVCVKNPQEPVQRKNCKIFQKKRTNNE